MERIIVTMTSWTKRIKNIPKVIDSIMNQTMKPNLMVVNLSIVEFPKKEESLPNEVLTYINRKHCINIEINWIDGINTRQWKKTIPTMLKYPNDFVICIDDDQLYKDNFIKILWEAHLKYPNNPITVNGGYKVHQCLQHCGHGTLECAKFYNNFNDIDFNELYPKASSDTFFTFMANKNGNPIIFCGKSLVSTTFNEIEPLSKTEDSKKITKHIEMWDFLTKKYGISFLTEKNKTKTNTIETTKKKKTINKTTIKKIK